MRRSGRIRNKVNYKTLDSRGMAHRNSDSENEDYVDADITGERELLSDVSSSSVDDSEDEREEGQISDEEESEAEVDLQKDPTVMECISKGDISKLRRLLKERQEECVKLKKEVAKEKAKEQKSKEM